MDVRVHRIGVGGHEDSRPASAHLVLVEIDLRVCRVVHHFHPVPSFYKVGLEEVPVVVVARVVVVKPWHTGPLIVGADIALVPVGNQNLAVRIRGRHEHCDHVVQNLTCYLIFRAGESVYQLNAGL